MRKAKPLPDVPLVFPRADPAALAAFNPLTKWCHMNCGRHRDDPRTKRECQFMCDECWPTEPHEHPYYKLA